MNYVTLILAVLVMAPPVNVLDAVLDARTENNPVLPDDLKKDRAGVSATWVTPPAQDAVERPSVTLYTADGNWCGPCRRLSKTLGLDKKARTITADLPFDLNIVLIPAEGRSPSGSVPCMQIDGTKTLLKGSSSVDAIIEWYNKNAPKVEAPAAAPGAAIVELEGWTNMGDAAARALAAHIERETNDSPAVGGIFDPKVNVDVEDSIVDFINALTSTGAKIGPATLVWPKGKVCFDPAIKLTVKKFLTFKASLNSIDFNGSEITFRLDGLPDLTVRFK